MIKVLKRLLLILLLIPLIVFEVLFRTLIVYIVWGYTPDEMLIEKISRWAND